ncbi:unnamed protein product [Clavelina lepadiformis]|uniref:Superoxide dismutase copper/zinc binding domain-containing protein n=1 Tax=Clavelina lepadiformis TaxID=159417 RepID=A0ABP0FV30_CLALP
MVRTDGIQFLLFLGVAVQLGLTQRYIATIDIAGYKGSITFEEQGDNINVNVKFYTGNITNYTTFEITEFPAIFGQLKNAQEVCSNLGGVLLELASFDNDSSFLLNNIRGDDIFNRGFLMTGQNGAPNLCGTILFDGNTQTYRAKFYGAVAGSVWIRTRESLTGAFILSELSYTNPEPSPNSTTSLTLGTYNGGVIRDDDFASRCNSISDPLTSLIVAVGNSAFSSGKISAIFASTFLAGAYLGLTDISQEMITCANLHVVSTKTVQADVSWLNIRGTISMTQKSPFDPTFTTVSFNGIQSIPAQYHVHKFPVPQRLSESDDRCSNDNVAGHFNPYAVVVADSPQDGTSDQYEIGDLSGKYGSVTNASHMGTYEDWNLPLFGYNSVVGRSIVVHRSDTSRVACATIGYPSKVTTAVIKFKVPAYGTMYLRQVEDKPYDDTTVFVELANLNGSVSMSHNYHVHVYPIGADCASAGPHYDPAEAATVVNYSQTCSIENPFHCELGDLSAKLGRINIGSSLRTSQKYFFTDENIPLFGAYSVIGRSIVVHDPNAAAPRYSCANITRLHSTSVRTVSSTWAGDNNDGNVIGHLSFVQNSEYDRTEVTSSVSGLNALAGQYHIHVLPIPEGVNGVDQCSVSSVEGHFNPFNIPSILPAQANTYDLYEVGDLSSKYGLIDGENDITLTDIADNNLPLTTGLVSVLDRSIVIHRPDSSRWKCNSLQMQPGDGTGYVIEALANFSFPYTGWVNLRQIVYEDGSSSLTSIELSMAYVNGTMTLDHNWHVHVDPVLNQGECGLAQGHFDPYMAVATASDYATQCNPRNPLACEVGDLSKKHTTHDFDGSRKLYLDEDIPLHTSLTVLGRSIVFHVKNAGAARQVCANILPNVAFTLAYNADGVEFDYYRFTRAVAETLRISRLRVVVMYNTDVPVVRNNCAQVMVHIAGAVSQERINILLEGTDSRLSPYNPTSSCVSEIGANIVGTRSGTPEMISNPIRRTQQDADDDITERLRRVFRLIVVYFWPKW